MADRPRRTVERSDSGLMWALLVDLVVVSLLIWIARDDWQKRLISVVTLALLAIFTVVKGLLIVRWSELLEIVIYNGSFVAIQMLLLYAWFCIKEQRFVTIIDQKIGLGDIAILLPMICAFSFSNFVFFYLGSLVFSLVIIVGLKALFQKEIKLIPLAGCQSIFWILFIVYANVFGINLLKDTIIPMI